MTRPTGVHCECGQLATHQSQRDATDDEALTYRRGFIDFRISHGLDLMPEDSPIMTMPVTVATFHCCEHRPEDLVACDACPESAP